MRVLVTGGSGFIGGFVVEKLASRGATPVVLDLVPPRDLEVAPPYRQGDVRDPAVVERAVAGCHAVVHLAGILGTDLTVDCPRETVETNLLGTLHVLESARRHGCRAVLINVGNDWDNPYTITKQAAVRFGLMYAREFGMPVTVIRAMNGYGPRQKADHTRKLVPTLVCAALRGSRYGGRWRRPRDVPSPSTRWPSASAASPIPGSPSCTSPCGAASRRAPGPSATPWGPPSTSATSRGRPWTRGSGARWPGTGTGSPSRPRRWGGETSHGDVERFVLRGAPGGGRPRVRGHPRLQRPGDPGSVPGGPGPPDPAASGDRGGGQRLLRRDRRRRPGVPGPSPSPEGGGGAVLRRGARAEPRRGRGPGRGHRLHRRRLRARAHVARAAPRAARGGWPCGRHGGGHRGPAPVARGEVRVRHGVPDRRPGRGGGGPPLSSGHLLHGQLRRAAPGAPLPRSLRRDHEDGPRRRPVLPPPPRGLPDRVRPRGPGRPRAPGLLQEGAAEAVPVRERGASPLPQALRPRRVGDPPRRPRREAP